MPFRIRPASEADAATTAALLNAIIAEGNLTSMDRPLTLEEQRAYLRSFPAQGIPARGIPARGIPARGIPARGIPARGVFHLAVQEETGELLGLQSVEPAQGDVGEISTFVALQAHRRGVGRALSAATFREAGRLGYTKLLALIRADNPGALAFYEGVGFRIVGTLARHVLVRGVLLDQVLAEKLLEP